MNPARERAVRDLSNVEAKPAKTIDAVSTEPDPSSGYTPPPWLKDRKDTDGGGTFIYDPATGKRRPAGEALPETAVANPEQE